MNNVMNLYPLNQRNSLELVEAYELVPILLNVSRKTKKQINHLNSQLDVYKGQAEKRNDIQENINELTTKWCDNMKRLGAVPTGPFKVRIPTNEGTFTWEFPSDQLKKDFN